MNKFLKRWKNSGTAWRGERLTLNTSEWTDLSEPCRSAGDVCSLWEVLEPKVANKYYLTEKVINIVLQRLKNKKKLEPNLEMALKATLHFQRGGMEM